MKPDKIDEYSVQILTPSTPREIPQFPIQTETPLLQNVKQIPKPSSQHKTITFEQFEMILTCHLEKSSKQYKKNLNHSLKKSVKQLQI